MGDERFTGIENELKAYRSLLDGGVSGKKEWEKGIDLILCRLPPLQNMTEALATTVEAVAAEHLVSETKFQEVQTVAQKVKTGVQNRILVSADKSMDSGVGGLKTQMRADTEELQAAQQVSFGSCRQGIIE